MQDVISDMQIFVAVCRARNFRRAAAALGIPNSTLSRRVAALEQGLGLQLLNRSSRKFELTEDGEVYLSQVGSLVERILVVHEDMRARKAVPSGHLRVSMPHGLAVSAGMFWLAEFAERFPEISFEVNTEPTNIDVLADRFDVAVRQEQPVDGHIYCRRAGSFTFFLYAAPAYIATHGMPERPEDLARHECIRTAWMSSKWTLNKGNLSATVNVSGKFLCDASVLARPLTLAGRGIAQLLGQTAAADEAAGRLVRILPDWTGEMVPLLLITGTKLLPSRTRLFIDFIAEKIRAFEMEGQ